MSLTRLKCLAVLTGAVAAVCLFSEARAQVRVLPNSAGGQPPRSTQATAAVTTAQAINRSGNMPIGGGFNPAMYGGVVPGGVGFPGWGMFNMDPAYGYLSGASQVINSQSEYMKAQQEASLMREQVSQSKLDTRKKTLDEWRYEQSIMPTAEELRTKQEKADLDRARNNPPTVDIWSGEAMNTLLRDVQKIQGLTGPGPTVLIDPAILPKISVTDGTSYGQGMLKDGGKLTWPFALEFDFFDEDRKRMDSKMDEAMSQLQGGKRPNARVIQDMLAVEGNLRDTLKTHIKDLTPSQGVEARRYLNDLHESIRTLQNQNVANYVSGKWAPKGDTVAELVANMSREGLRFSASAPGNESAYSALYQAMVNYNRAISAVSSHMSTKQ